MFPVNSVTYVPGCSVLEKLLELFDGETRVTNDAAHCEFIDGVVARNRKNAAPVTHHNVLPLADDLETGFFQSTNGPQMIDAGQLRHNSSWNFDLAHLRALGNPDGCLKVFANRVLNIFERLALGLPLGPATRKTRTRHAVSFFRFPKSNLVFHVDFILAQVVVLRQSS